MPINYVFLIYYSSKLNRQFNLIPRKTFYEPNLEAINLLLYYSDSTEPIMKQLNKHEDL